MKVYMNGVMDISEKRRDNEPATNYEVRKFDNSVIQAVGVINSLLEEDIYMDDVSDEDKKVLMESIVKIIRSSISTSVHAQPVYDGEEGVFVLAMFDTPPTSYREILKDEKGFYIEV